MDIIKLDNAPGDAETELSSGKAVNGWDRALWVERYQKPGEFKLEGRLSEGLKETLSLGSIISHVRTQELMIVENQEIHQPDDEDPRISITGRSFISYLDQRVIGDDHAFVGSPTTVPTYDLVAAPTWEQIVQILTDHIVSPITTDNALQGVAADHICTGSPPTEARNLRIQPVLDIVLELLKVDDIGIKVVRPTSTEPLTYIYLYQGANRASTVRFSWIGGDLTELDYFFSLKARKTHARVVGRWVQVVSSRPTTHVNYDRRIMYVNGSDIDQQENVMPTGTPLFDIRDKMLVRGNEAIQNQNNKTITRVDVSPNAQWRYREDYSLGDLVSIDGDFGASAIMRVVEFAEVEDENGTSGHPTLAIPGEN